MLLVYCILDDKDPTQSWQLEGGRLLGTGQLIAELINIHMCLLIHEYLVVILCVCVCALLWLCSMQTWPPGSTRPSPTQSQPIGVW